MKALGYVSLIAAMSLSANVSAADKPYKKDFSEAIHEYAIVVVTTRANWLTMHMIDVTEQKFDGYKESFQLPISEKWIKRFKHQDAHANGFYVRYVPAGTYAYTSSNYSSVRGNRRYVKSACKSDGAPTFEFAVGDIYYFNPNDKFANAEKKLSAVKSGAVGFIADETESLNWLDNYFEKELGYKEKVQLAESIGEIKFDGDVKRSLGIVGNKSIKCPHGKDFVFSGTELD